MKRKISDVEKILVVTLSNLGDVVLTLPVLQSLLESYPGCRLDVIAGSEAGASVFRGDDRIRQVTVYDKRGPFREKLELLKKIRAERYDLIVDLRRSLFGLLGGARHRNAYLSFLPGKKSHRVLRHLFALKDIVAFHHTKSFLWERTAPEGPDFAFVKDAEEKGQKLVLAAPGSKSDLKKWPAASYARLLDRLALEENCRVVLIGDKNDAADAAKVRGLMKAPVEDLSGRTDFLGLVSLVKKADLVVTNDSAPLHVADALRRPVLAIFGPTDPRKYGPRYRYSAVARRQLFCAPCERAQCRFKHECMTELTVEEVHQKARSILHDTLDRKNLRLLVIRLDRIGDLTLSLPAVQALRDRFPNAHIAMMTRPATAPLVEGHPAVDEVIPYFYEKKGRHAGVAGNFRFIYEIVRRRFDIVFVLNPSLRSYLVPFMAGIPYRVGFEAPALFLLTHSVPDRRSDGAKHEAEYTLDVVRAFGVEAGRADSYEGTLKHLAEKEMRRDDVVALHPGASCPSKRWPRERFADLARRMLAERPGTKIVIVGGKEEVPLGEYLRREIGEASEDLTGKLDLKELARILSACALLVSNDSGPVHIAAAVGTRTFTVFGRSLPGLGPVRWRALGKGHELIRKDAGCVVCLAHRCTIDFECLKLVTVEEVWKKLRPMLAATAVSVR